MLKKSFEAYGLPCLVCETDSVWCLCGYVGLPKTHPMYGKTYDQIYCMDCCPSVHGGLTYSDDINPGTRNEDGRWWIGFDCAHCGDYVPGILQFRDEDELHHWTVDEVADETRRLAEQLAEVNA